MRLGASLPRQKRSGKIWYQIVSAGHCGADAISDSFIHGKRKYCGILPGIAARSGV